jgi:hypothetical protein
LSQGYLINLLVWLFWKIDHNEIKAENHFKVVTIAKGNYGFVMIKASPEA